VALRDPTRRLLKCALLGAVLVAGAGCTGLNQVDACDQRRPEPASVNQLRDGRQALDSPRAGIKRQGSRRYNRRFQ